MKRLCLCITFLLPMFCVVAQQRGMKPVELTVDGKSTILYKQSHALLIGVSAYSMGLPPLPGVNGDIDRVKASLESNGFDVTKVMNPDAAGLQKAFNTFISQYGQGADNRLLIYFAGHGYTEKMPYGEDIGYICPVDAPNPLKDPVNFQAKAMPMGQIEIYAKQIKSKHALFLFDACFSGSIFSTSRAIPEIISYKTTQPVRQFITSGSAEETVPDKSIFQSQLIRALNGEADVNKDGFLTGTELGDFLQSTVVNYSYGSQHPQYGKIRNPNLDKGDFVFVINGQSQGKRISSSDAAVFSQGTANEHDAETEISNLAVKGKTNFPIMALVKGGTFLMGSDEGETDEKPVHFVRIGDFNLGKYEITVAQFQQFIISTNYQTDAEKGTGSNTWDGKKWEKRSDIDWRCDEEGNTRPKSEYNHPVIHVSWSDAMEYCKWLSKETGMQYRLPTEAEWEYAAGNGSKHTKYDWGNDNPHEKFGGNVADESLKRKIPEYKIFNGFDDYYVYTAPIGCYNPNEFGLYDMTGNVSEWCGDIYDENYYKVSLTDNPQGATNGFYRCIRGGSWLKPPEATKNTYRARELPENISSARVGFRVARDK